MSPSSEIFSFFEQLTSALGEGVTLLDDEGNILASNPAMSEIFGYTAKELNGHGIDKVLEKSFGLDKLGFQPAEKDSGSAPTEQDLELRGRDKDGILFPIQLKLRALSFGEKSFPLCTIKSLYGEQAALRRLKRQSDLLEQAEKLALVGHWRVNVEQESVFWSKEIYRIHGVTPETYTPELQSAIDFYHPDDRDMVSESVAKSIETGEKIGFNARIVRPSGEVRIVRTSGECTKSDNETILFGVFQDVTEQEANRIELQGNHNFLNQMMESNPDLLFVKDQDFKIIRANQAFLNVYPEEMRDKVIGYTTLESYNEEEAELFLQYDKQAFKEGMSETEETVQFPDGATRTLMTKKVRFEDGKGKPYILGIGRDITKIKHAEVALKQANDELKEFAYRTSHDLRSPIVSTLSLLSMAKDSVANNDVETVNQALDLSLSSLGKLDLLIKDLLTLTKARNQIEDEAEMDIGHTIASALEKFSHMDNFDRVKIAQSIAFSEPIMVKKSRLTLIIENLISNAIKYQDESESQSVIHISCYEKDGRIVFSVEDNGIGIPEDQHDKMFQMFQRFHTRISYGSGLGLYMIKKSADILGAAIQFEALDKGSRFTLNLPKR